MKRLSLFLAVLMILLVAAPELSLAVDRRGGGVVDTGRGSGGWGLGGPYARMYNPDTVERIQGTVENVKTFSSRGMTPGVHFTLKTDTETIPVHLGPSWFLDRQDVQLRAGDSVEVIGSRVTFDNKPAIIASEVKRGNEVLVLRDENGIPNWAGWRRPGVGG